MKITMKYAEYMKKYVFCETEKGSYNKVDKTIAVFVPDTQDEIIALRIRHDVHIPEVAVRNVMRWGSAGCEAKLAAGREMLKNLPEDKRGRLMEQMGDIEKAAAILKKYGR